MPDPRTPGGLKTTPRQLSLIAAVGLALAGVLIAQFGSATVSPGPTPSTGANETAKAATASPNQTRVPAPTPPLPSARSRGDQVGLIGDRVVRVGDMIEGYRVQSIDGGGVLLVPSRHKVAREERKR